MRVRTGALRHGGTSQQVPCTCLHPICSPALAPAAPRRENAVDTQTPPFSSTLTAQLFFIFTSRFSVPEAEAEAAWEAAATSGGSSNTSPSSFITPLVLVADLTTGPPPTEVVVRIGVPAIVIMEESSKSDGASSLPEARAEAGGEASGDAADPDAGGAGGATPCIFDDK